MFVFPSSGGGVIQYPIVLALVAAACMAATAVGHAALPAYSQSPPQFPTFEISANPETFHAAPSAVHLRPSSVPDPDQSAAEAEWVEFSYSPTDLSDLLVSPTVSTDLFPAACDTAPPNVPVLRFAACPAFNTPLSGDWALSFQSKAWNGAVDSDGWRVNALLHDVTIAAASDLSTPLDQFTGATTPGGDISSELGISKNSPWSLSGAENTSMGISVRTHSGLEVIGTSAGVQAYQHVTIATADLFAGITPLGPLVGADATFGALSISTVALDLGGQFQAAATISLQMGDLRLSYVDGPASNSIVAIFDQQPVKFGFSVDSSDFGVTLAYDLGDGRTFQASGSGQNGFQVAFVASIGLGSPATVPLGPSALSLTPQPWSSTPAFRWRLPFSAAKPLPSQPSATTSPSSVGEENAPQGTDDEEN